VRSFSAGCSLCSSRVLQALSFNPFDSVGLVARVGRTVREESADSPPGADGLQVSADSPFLAMHYWRFGNQFRVVRPVPVDGPPGARG
jgi:hypothetical protein